MKWYSIRTYFLLFPLISCFMLGSCFQAPKPLRVGSIIWPGYDNIFLALNLGFIKSDSVKIIEFSSATEVVRAYRNGLIDAACLTMDEALLITQIQKNHKIVLIFDYSNGSDVILSKPLFHSLKEMKGKRIGVEATVLGAYFLARALNHEGLNPNDIISVPVPLIEHESAFLSGKVDAIVTFDPHRTRLLNTGARILFDSSRIPFEIVDVLLTRSNLSDDQNNKLNELISGHFKALEYMRTNRNDAAERIALREGISKEEFLESLKLIFIPDRNENAILLNKKTGKIIEIAKQLSSLMYSNHFIDQTNSLPAIDDSYVSEKQE